MKIKYSEGINICNGKRYIQRKILKKYLTGGNIDIIRSDLVGVPVSRLNVIISLGLADESVSRLNTIIKSGLASAPVLKLDVILNAAIR